MRFQKILDTFPPPQFLNVVCTSLVFSDSHIRALRLDPQTKHPEFSAEIELAPGIIESGIIKKEKELVDVLSQLKGSLKGPFVKIGFPDEVCYVFTADIPVFPGKNARESVAFILEENVPLPLADVSFDFTPLTIVPDGEGFVSRVAVTAISNDVLNGYMKVIEAAGMEIMFASSESQAIARSLVPQDETGVSAIIYVHRSTVGIYFVSGHTVEFSSIIQLPEREVSESFASFVVNEFVKALEYRQEHVSRCFLCGRYDASEAVLKAFAAVPQVSASIGNVWVNAFLLDTYIPKISFEESLRFGGAVGLCL